MKFLQHLESHLPHHLFRRHRARARWLHSVPARLRYAMSHTGVAAMPRQVASATSGLMHRHPAMSLSNGAIALVGIAVFAAYVLTNRS